MLIERPDMLPEGRSAATDVLSGVLRAVRLSGSVQFCIMSSGAWRTDAAPSLAGLAARSSGVTSFHIVVEGSCWLRMEGEEVALSAGDVVAFPFGTGHQLGAGRGDALVTPMNDLPPKPWREIPVLRYGAGDGAVRLLCGFLEFGATSFGPLRDALPKLLLARTREVAALGWMRATIDQIVAEVDQPRAGGVSMLERLTETLFIELLRHHLSSIGSQARGWLAAMSDPALARCLSVVHAEPARDWSIKTLAAAAGLSRSALTERFEAVLRVSPMRYVREWRLCLAGVALDATRAPIAAVAQDAGYGTEAAFSRAFSRANGISPAAWRALARTAASGGDSA
jgi:AraC-like DNA-binding protein/mannose-6-phosphate isomerase-like protein (cupin superfamily)